MKKLWIFPIFAAGATLGWMVRDNAGPEPKAAEIDSPQIKASRTRGPASSKTKEHDRKWTTFGKRAKDLDYKEKESVLRELAPKDRMAALEALAAQAGLDGLHYQVKAMMDKILETWADEDFQDAWTTAQNESNPDLRKLMMTKILNQLAKKDPDRAFAIHLEQKALDPEFSSSAEIFILDAKLKLGADEYLKVLSQIEFGPGSSGSAAEYPIGFDFQLAADGVVKLMKDHDNQGPSSFPTNFFKEWAKQDPEAAFAMWAGNAPMPFNNLEDVIEGREIRAPGSSPSWIASKLQDTTAPREKIIKEVAQPSSNQFAPRIQLIAQALPDAPMRDEFLTEILVQNSYSSNFLLLCENVVSDLSSVEARLAAFQQMRRKRSWDNAEIDKISDAQLQAWSVTRDQMRQILVQ
ncbi:MAG TPA: hypothetical protein VF258_03625 [Luteolibacter sp.]